MLCILRISVSFSIQCTRNCSNVTVKQQSNSWQKYIHLKQKEIILYSVTLELALISCASDKLVSWLLYFDKKSQNCILLFNIVNLHSANWQEAVDLLNETLNMVMSMINSQKKTWDTVSKSVWFTTYYYYMCGFQFSIITLVNNSLQNAGFLFSLVCFICCII